MHESPHSHPAGTEPAAAAAPVHGVNSSSSSAYVIDGRVVEGAEKGGVGQQGADGSLHASANMVDSDESAPAAAGAAAPPPASGASKAQGVYEVRDVLLRCSTVPAGRTVPTSHFIEYHGGEPY